MADDVNITISLDRNKIGQEEVATLTVEVSSTSQQNLPKPKLPPLPQFDVYSLGTSRQIVQNGNNLTVTSIYNYALSPKKTGVFPIHSVWIVYNGKRYESNELQLEVVQSAQEASGPIGKQSVDNTGKQKKLFVVTETDKKNAYVDEQVTLTLKFYHLARMRLLSTPSLSRLSAPDFWINDIPPQKQYNQLINGQEYHVYELRWALYPTKSGKLKIDGARISVTVPDRQRRRTRDPFSILGDMFEQGKNVTLRSNTITVNVSPLPMAGKPKDFSGAVGQYKITAKVDRTNVEVNESITLTVKISGRGNVKSIPEPTLPKLDGFRVEKSSSDFKQATMGTELGGTKTFEYVLLPRIPGAQKIPPITLSFFDPLQKKYRTVMSKPIQLQIKRGEMTSASEMPVNTIAGQTIHLQETDIRFIKTTGTHLVRRGTITLTSPLFLAIIGVPFLALLGGVIDVRRKKKLAGDVAYARLKKAKRVAKKRLKQAETYLHKDKNAFYAELSGVIYQFIADKMNRSAQGLTSDMVKQLLLEKNASEEVIEEVLDVLKEADFGRFAASGEGDDKKRLYERAEKLISELEDTL